MNTINHRINNNIIINNCIQNMNINMHNNTIGLRWPLALAILRVPHESQALLISRHPWRLRRQLGLLWGMLPNPSGCAGVWEGPKCVKAGPTIEPISRCMGRLLFSETATNAYSRICVFDRCRKKVRNMFMICIKRWPDINVVVQRAPFPPVMQCWARHQHLPQNKLCTSGSTL